METKQKVKVAILTFLNGATNQREIFGVYKNINAANDALNDELFMAHYSNPNPDETEIERIYNELKPEIEEHFICG